MIGEIADKVKGVFGVRSISVEMASTSNTIHEENIDMEGYDKEGRKYSFGSNVVHCGPMDTIDALTSGKSTVIIPNQRRRRLSKKSESNDSDASIISLAEEQVVSFGAEDTVFIIKGGSIEGEATVAEIADAINDCTRKDNAIETAEIFAKMGYNRRRSSVLRDKELELAAAELGDRII